MPGAACRAPRRVTISRLRACCGPSGDKTICEAVKCAGPLYERLARPLFVAALNTEPQEGSAALAGAIVRETLVAGGQACRPLIARDGLGPAFIEPALRYLQARGAPVQFGHRLRSLEFVDDKVSALDFGEDKVAVGEGDAVILAVPPVVAAALLPNLTVPTEFRAIVNVHFRIDPPPDLAPIIGVVNATIEWLFAFPGRLSVTISAADRLLDVAARGTRADGVAGGGGCGRPSQRAAAVANRARTPRHLRGHAAAERQAARRRHRMAQSRAGRRLDADRPARHHRGRDPLRQPRGRPCRLGIGMNGVSAEQNPTAPDKATLDRSIASATGALLDLQQPDGHWVFELEADATIPAEYVLLRHYFGEPVDKELEAKIGAYLRRIQSRQHRGWPLFYGGAFDMSATVKAYFALKMIGDDPEAPHMRLARDAIQAHPGGAARCNVFTRALLALYGFLPWRSVPVMPVEIMLLPRWFPFHLDKISYWGRTVIVPLLVLMTLKPKAKNPLGVRIDELFEQPPETIGPPKRAPHQKRGWFAFFAAVDRVLRLAEPYMPKAQRQRAIDARGRLGRRAPQRRGRAGRDLSGDGQQRDDVRRARLSAGSSAAGGGARARSTSCWWCMRTRPIASPASRRSGIPGSPAMRCLKPATNARWRRRARRSTGWRPSRFWT